ncbi:glycerol dehydrogenase [Pararhizobium sp.]|uniref:glycerol dehydrogenase n=1 Tax=Pararhizobium sp. TaxID=1977563 RepID=UPI00271C240D|nr:glycerol dehydrogenase [Pararhizobium sp.]MDO9416745.1 glycerol dehydrogenase [Pararhizobium sp.]
MAESGTEGARSAAGRSFAGPGKYIQRAGEIERLGEHLKPLGCNLFILVDGFIQDAYGATLEKTLAASGLQFHLERFAGECCTSEIDRVIGLVRHAQASVVVGIGGGKTADTAKLAAIATHARIVTVPTIASTDAPCSAVAVRYSEEGVYQQSHFLPRNPDAVVVDSALIAKAPARFLAAGIGDALSTWFEARSNLESRSSNLASPNLPPTAAGIAIAKTCHDVLMRDAVAAMHAVRKGALTQAVENIIEANTLLSGLGFENCGVSAAHGIHDGLTVLDETHGFYHGEKVAFGVLCLLMLEGRPLSEISEMVQLCRSIGLPTTLADLNLATVSKEDLERVAVAALAPGSATWKVAIPLSVAIVRDAIIATDAFTRSFAA